MSEGLPLHWLLGADADHCENLTAVRKYRRGPVGPADHGPHTPHAAAQFRAIRTRCGTHQRHCLRRRRHPRDAPSVSPQGYGMLNYLPGLGRRKVIESLTLNARGIARAEQNADVAPPIFLEPMAS